MSMSGYYKVQIEQSGFKTPVVVYALSGAQAAQKVLEGRCEEAGDVRLFDVEGPYLVMTPLD